MRGDKPKLQAIEGGLAKAPPAPAWLPEESRAVWRKVWPGLVKRRTITKEDVPIVEQYALALGTVHRMQAIIADEGDTIQTNTGPRRHPAFQTLFQALTESRRLAAELGLTPASRNKAKGSDTPDDDLAGLDL